MNKKQLFMHLFSFLCSIPLWGMESSIRFTNNYNDDYPYLVSNAYENPSFNDYAMEQFVFNQKGSIKEMNNAVAAGKRAYLTVGNHSENKMSAYNTTTKKRDAEIHGKLTVGLDSSPSKENKPQKGILLFGSANTTNMTWKHRMSRFGKDYNFETGIEIINDMDVIPTAYTKVKEQQPMLPAHEKKLIDTTPEKIAIFSSCDTDLNKSLAQRLKNTAARNGNAAVRSMTFSDKEIANELSALGPNAKLIVDNSALTSNGIPLLQQVHDSGAGVFVFRPAKKESRVKQHGKGTIIEAEATDTTEKSTLYIESTANITAEGNKQRNYQLYIPNNKAIIADAKADFNRVEKECISFPKALELKEADVLQKKTDKRKLEAGALKPSAKKQKTTHK